jgi:hypothetical protein
VGRLRGIPGRRAFAFELHEMNCRNCSGRRSFHLAALFGAPVLRTGTMTISIKHILVTET